MKGSKTKKTRKESPKPAQAYYDSIAAAAAAMDVAPSLLKRAKRAKLAGAAFRGGRVYSTPELRAWLNEQAVVVTADPERVKQEIQEQLLREKKFRNDQREDRFLPKSETLAELEGLAELLKSKLRSALEDDLPPIICNQPAPIVRAHMKELVDRLCRDFQETMGKL